MIIDDDGTIWGEEKDRRDELIYWLIDECKGRSEADCEECHYKKICNQYAQDIDSRWKYIYSNLQEYDRIHAERDSKPPSKRS